MNDQSPAALSEEAPAKEAGNPPPTAAAHDSDVPAALEAFMLQGWAPRTVDATPIPHLAAFQARRRALCALYPGEILIVPTGHPKVRANDTVYRFRPGSDFAWLTGNHEPDCVLVLLPRATGGHEEVLYVEPSTRGNITFFTDRQRGELWVGPRLGVEASAVRFGVDRCCALGELPAWLATLAAQDAAPRRLLRGLDTASDAALPERPEDADLAARLSELRLRKDAQEIEELSVVIAATKRGFEDVIRGLRTARSEREVEGIFSLRARVEGNDVGYGTIAACGAHACILHWTRNDGPVQAGDTLLLDAGVEGHSLYTADITRVFPISGRFTPEQREIYDLVYAAQRAAIAAVRPGIDFTAPNKVAMRVLAEGLERLGILPGTAEDALQDDKQLYRRYSLHNISHMLGIDVHDCAKARKETYKFGQLTPGMVFTVEPGLYFQPDDLTVPERYRGIGVRIEDDLVVTEDGCRVLSADLPVAADDVEAWMARVWAS